MLRLVFSTTGLSPSGIVISPPRHEVIRGNCLSTRTIKIKTDAGLRDVSALYLDDRRVAVNRGEGGLVEWYVHDRWLASAGWTVDTLGYTVEGREPVAGEGRCVFCAFRGHIKGKKNVSSTLVRLVYDQLHYNVVCKRPKCQALAKKEFQRCIRHTPSLFHTGDSCPMCRALSSGRERAAAT